jgi:hypothetical protein
LTSSRLARMDDGAARGSTHLGVELCGSTKRERTKSLDLVAGGSGVSSSEPAKSRQRLSVKSVRLEATGGCCSTTSDDSSTSRDEDFLTPALGRLHSMEGAGAGRDSPQHSSLLREPPGKDTDEIEQLMSQIVAGAVAEATWRARWCQGLRLDPTDEFMTLVAAATPSSPSTVCVVLKDVEQD